MGIYSKFLSVFLFFVSASYAEAQIFTSYPYILQNGTTADATQVMADFNQIANNVNASAAKNGINTDLTQILGMSAGTAAAPSYSFSGHLNYGMYYDTTHTGTALAGGGIEGLYVDSSGVVHFPLSPAFAGQINSQWGSAGTPTYSFTTPSPGNLSGLYFDNINQGPALSASGIEQFVCYGGSTGICKGLNEFQVVQGAHNAGRFYQDTSGNLFLSNTNNGSNTIINAAPSGSIVLNPGSNGGIALQPNASFNSIFVGSNYHVTLGGPEPGVSGCGSSPTWSGSDNMGFVTTGSGATSCAINFANAYGSAPACIAVGAGGNTPNLAWSVSTVHIVLSGSGFGGGQSYIWLCYGA